ncbi:MAG: hypothetical protein K0S27_1080 [Gammaproteobacteria bacterium]|nr:hypothetical protein [Gammaproteobacteria bacterium]
MTTSVNHLTSDDYTLTDIALIGMSGRFPGAQNVDDFWENLLNGVESLRQFTTDELKEAGESEALLKDPKYVPTNGILENIEWFDAPFFGINPQDAKLMDPQQRVFLECGWEALESAGYVPEKYKGVIGVYASMADSTYLQHNILKNQDMLKSLDWFQARIATSITTLSTQLSYRLNLKGPSLNVVTACSSSLVAIATACRSLIDYECDMAVAGAAAIAVPQLRGYLFQEGGIESPDGHCRVFEANSKGTVFSNGVGVVVLKRLQDAIREGDHIYAVIKGWNINNDGADKAGFSAPSVSGQARCMASALAFANIRAESISYIETHGTGTSVGDPIELKALTHAFHLTTNKKSFCAIGSVKTNIGHTDIASGMPSVMKVAMALKHKMIPATLHYKDPSPHIDFPNTPFYVNAQFQEWSESILPRRACVNASGIGGTNAFLVMEEYEKIKQNHPSRPCQLLLLSAKTKSSLEQATQKLKEHLAKINTPEELADTAFTLQVGRADFNHRKFLVCRDAEDALAILNEASSPRLFTKNYSGYDSPKIVFMFPGQGSQYVGMANDLYYSEPEFAKWIDTCCDYLNASTRQAVHNLIFRRDNENLDVHDTAIVQPSLFIIEYALANLFISLGVQPQAMIGHSIGEYVAACLADVISLEDALRIVCQRGRLMSNTLPGAMLAILLPEDQLITTTVEGEVSLAAVNSPSNCVVSATENVIFALEKEYEKLGVVTRRVRTSHAFHSHLMEPALNDFLALLNKITFRKPLIPFISNLTGTWIRDEEAMSPNYWVNHLRQTVKFLPGLQTLINERYMAFIEVGPGKTLTHFTNELIKRNEDFCVQNILSSANNKITGQESFLLTLGRLWLYGVKIDWDHFYTYEKRSRIPLPTYSFDRQYYWIESDFDQKEQISAERQPYEKWFYEPSWVRTSLQCTRVIPENTFSTPACWVILLDAEGIGGTLAAILASHHQLVIMVKPASCFRQCNDHQYEINVGKKEDYLSFVKAILKISSLPLCVINLLPLTAEHTMTDLNTAEIETTLTQSFYSTLFFTQALTEQSYNKANILVVSNELFSVMGQEAVYPAKATAIGPCRVISQEQPSFNIRLVDIVLSDFVESEKRRELCNQLILDTFSNDSTSSEKIFSYRYSWKWIQEFRPLKFMTNVNLKLAQEGVFIFTGGLGGISLTLAKKMALTQSNAHLILFSRSFFPPQAEWQSWVETHPKANSISKKIALLKDITQLGAKVSIYQVDITHYEELKNCIAEIKNKFNKINGVIHAAGVAGGGLAQLKTSEMANKVFAPKVMGTYMLVHILREEALDFFVLCSSISSVLGLLSQVDYCAANACLDAFTSLKLFKNEVPCISINWNTWRDIGMAAEIDKPADVVYSAQNNNISPLEGGNVFVDVVMNPYKQVIISAVPLTSALPVQESGKNGKKQQNTLVKREEIIADVNDYLPPTNEIEKKLATIWQDLLGIDKISMQDDFFMLGGHSLMALKLLSRLEKEMNVKISLQTLNEGKTIQKIAEAVSSSLSGKMIEYSSILVPIRSGGEKSPLFLMHPVGGDIFCYLPLARHLKWDAPIYGLQDPSLGQEKLIYSSIKEMAADYIVAIKQIQPKGPYLLGGLSFGATLSVEMANQLHQQGEKVRPLLLFDGWARFSEEQHIQNIFMEAMSRLSESKACDEQFAKMSWARMCLLLNYEIPPILVKMMLFKASELLPEYQPIDHKYSHWSRYTDESNIDLYITPGNHETILAEPNVAVLANKVDEILDKIILPTEEVN